MLDETKKVALVLGGGKLTQCLIRECQINKINFIIIALSEFYELANDNKPDYLVSYDNLGNIFSILRSCKINSVMFLGSFKKKPLLKLRPNILTLYYIIRILFYYNKGDSLLLNKIMKIFTKKGYEVLDSRIFLKKYLATDAYNNIENFNEIITKEKIKFYFKLAKKFGTEDKGQAIIVSNGKILLTEDRNGTDHMIKRYKKFSSKEPAFLIKVSKPNQDLKIDLPTIGPNTIDKMIEVGLKGIVLERNKTYITDIEKTNSSIKKNNLLYYAFHK